MTDEGQVVLTSGTATGTLDCPNCAERVATRVRGLPGIQTVTLDREPSPARLRYTYETEAVTPATVEDLVAREMADSEAHYVHQVLAIEGMDCADCAMTLERGVGRLAGVEEASVNFGAARMTVEYDRRSIDLPAIDRRIRELGYAISQPDREVESERSALWRLVTRRDNLLALTAGVLTLAGGIGQLLSVPSSLSIAAYAAAVVVGGVPLARKGLRVLRTTHSLDINLLMTIAVIGAVAIGEWFEAATVVFLFSLGEALEGYAMDRVRRSVRSLLALAPPVALVRRGAAEAELPVSEVAVGETVIIRSGERVPLDGVVVGGMSSVDQSSLTGESLPVGKEPGDPLFAGTMNGSGPLTMQVTRLAGDSSVARIIRLVETAQAQRAPVQRVVDRFARVYTPAVIAIATLVAVVPPLFGASWIEWFSRALVLLVISCPCALVLSTPISIVSALSAAARNGVLIKGGAILERIGAVDTVAFDKTGTLTTGRPSISRVTPITAPDEAAVLALAATLERHSEHPLGRAVVQAAQDRDLNVDEATDERVIHGAGLIGVVNGVEYRIGSARLFDNAALGVDVTRAVSEIENDGGTAVLVGTADSIDGVIGFADTLRPDAMSALSALHAAGVRKVVILSGDREGAVDSIASAAGIDEARSGLLPEEKLAAIGELRERGGVVAMVGDGVNDAPSLAAADVGIAMGVAGTDAAVETADIALMGDDLRGLAATIRMGRRAKRIVTANIALSLGTKAIFLGLAVSGSATLWMAIAADLGTSLLVIANGMRLLRWPR
ncbi:MAG TPA: cation-translocating P-type ATPase [Thermomicrobiales bacterium]|nr:cation-translocating P-type ATPase [Thermomicrobiales bacterium]